LTTLSSISLVTHTTGMTHFKDTNKKTELQTAEALRNHVYLRMARSGKIQRGIISSSHFCVDEVRNTKGGMFVPLHII